MQSGMFGKISVIRAKLPADIDEPIVEKWIRMPPLSCGLLSRQRSVRELSTYADEILKEQLQRINGVGALRMYGLRFDRKGFGSMPTRLRAYGVTAQDVMRSLQKRILNCRVVA